MLSRNPVIAALTAALLLAGCGATSRLTSPTVVRSAPMVVQQTDKVTEPLKANKDWQIIEGDVVKLLPDDNDDRPHQHFLVQIAPKKVVKVAHNTALAPYVPVKVGSHVVIKCEYIKASPYDVAHWTHYDPAGGEGGYIELDGRKFDKL